jgi:hypothetical protein
LSDWDFRALLQVDDLVEVLSEEERAVADRVLGVGSWRDWTREELYVVLVVDYAQELARALLWAGVPAYVFDDRIGPVLDGLDRERS